MTSLTGNIIGHYRIMEKLGSGGMAEVYRAHHTNLDRYVAIKFIRTELAENEDFQARFEREARTAAKLQHNHIVLIHDSGRQENLFYLVMEYIEGVTLKQLLLDRQKQGERLPANQILNLMAQVASALDYAHDQDVVHRDVKPDNILLRGDGSAVLTDFGIARMMNDTSNLTMTGATMGTPTYMSPEQIQGIRNKIGRHSDIYSLGVILYEMLIGRVPFVADTPFAVMMKHVSEPVPFPENSNPAVSPEIQRVIYKALSKDPIDRYKSAGQMVDELSSATAGLNTETRPNRTSSQRTNRREAIDPTLVEAIRQTNPPPASTPHADTEVIPTTGESTVIREKATVTASPPPNIVESPPQKRKRRWWSWLIPIPVIAIIAIFVISLLQEESSGRPSQVLLTSNSQIFSVGSTEDAEVRNVSNRFTNSTGFSGTDHEFSFSPNAGWAVGITERFAECDLYSSCLAVTSGSLDQLDLVRVQGSPVYAEEAIISNDGLEILYAIIEDEAFAFYLLARDSLDTNNWEVTDSYDFGDQFVWYDFVTHSAQEDKFMMVCSTTLYDIEGGALCEYDGNTEQFRVIMTLDQHNQATGEDAVVLYDPFYDLDGIRYYTTSASSKTWQIEETESTDDEMSYAPELFYHDTVICILPNGRGVIPEWIDDDVFLTFVNFEEQSQHQIPLNLDSDEAYNFSCGGD